MQCQQQQGGDLGDVGLGGRHADLEAGACEQHGVGLASGLAAHDVGERQHRRAGLAREPHGGQRVEGLARLGDADHQDVVAEHRVAVAKLAGQVDLHGQLGEGLHGIRGDQAGVVRGAAADDEHAAEVAQQVDGQVDLGEVDLPVVAQPAGKRVGQRLRLLVDLLDHEGLVAALLGGVGVPGDLAVFALDRRRPRGRSRRRRRPRSRRRRRRRAP